MAASEFQGMRVIPGNEWTLDEVDRNEIGTIIKYDQVEDSNKYVNITVAWDSGKETFHKYPTGDVLKILNTDILGVLHGDKKCNTCNMKVAGILWMCAEKECKQLINLCNSCYHGDKHSTDHKFYRIDMEKKISWVIRPERKKSQKISLHGICSGATVVRRDKEKSTQVAEGTSTSQKTDKKMGIKIKRNPPVNPDEGRVIGFAFRNKSWIAQVKWNRQSQLDSSCLAEDLVMSKTFQGKHPLKCTRPKPWISVYRDHLPEPKDLDLGEYGYGDSDVSGGSWTSTHVSGGSLTSLREETEMYLQTTASETSAKNARVVTAFGPNAHISRQVSVGEMIHNVVDHGKPDVLHGVYNGGAMEFPRNCVVLGEEMHAGQIHASSRGTPLPPAPLSDPSVAPPLPCRNRKGTGSPMPVLRTKVTPRQEDKIPEEPSSYMAPQTPQMGLVAHVLYKFTATEEGILNVEKGDMIFDIYPSEEGWLNGWLNGKRGNIAEEMVKIEEIDYEQMQKMMTVSERKQEEVLSSNEQNPGLETFHQTCHYPKPAEKAKIVRKIHEQAKSVKLAVTTKSWHVNENSRKSGGCCCSSTEFTIAKMKYGFEDLCKGDIILEVKPESEDNKWMHGLLRGEHIKFPARLSKIEVITKEEYENLRSDQMITGSGVQQNYVNSRNKSPILVPRKKVERNVNTENVIFKAGDKVMLKNISDDEIREKQQGYGSWYDFMDELRGEEGEIVGEMAPGKGVIVEFNKVGRPRLNPEILIHLGTQSKAGISSLFGSFNERL